MWWPTSCVPSTGSSRYMRTVHANVYVTRATPTPPATHIFFLPHFVLSYSFLLNCFSESRQVPTLESIHAEHNMLTTARVPYSTTHMGRVPITKKAVMGSGEDGVMVAARTSSSAAAGGSSGNEQHGMPHLSEMYLAGNRITSLASMDSLGHCAEVIDLSNNALADALAVVAALKQMHKLSELRLAGNPCVLEGMLHSVAESLAHDCGVLQMVDDLVIVGGRVVGVGSPQKAPVQAFHTWEREVDDGEGESAPSTQRSTAAPPAADDEDADSEDDEEFLKDETVGTFRQRGESIPDANVHQVYCHCHCLPLPLPLPPATATVGIPH